MQCSEMCKQLTTAKTMITTMTQPMTIPITWSVPLWLLSELDEEFPVDENESFHEFSKH